jgi:HlyD family secretion protein
MPDIVRDPAILKRKKLRHALYAAVGVLIVVAVSIALARMEPAAPTVDKATVLMDTVKRGSIIRQHRGLGTLVPEDTRWLPSRTNGRVERILLRPGAQVEPDTVILELTNPDVEQEALNSRLALHSAEAALENLRVQLDNELLTQESQTAAIQAEYEQAKMQAEADEALAKEQLISEITRRKSQLTAETLKKRSAFEAQRLASSKQSLEGRLRVQQAAVDQARAVSNLQQSRIESLKVRPGFSGVL